MPFTRAATRCAGCVLLLVAFATGCATSSRSDPSTAKPTLTPLPPERERLSDDHVAAQEVLEARKMIDAGDTSAVIPKLLTTISKYPASEAGLEARYWLGRAYYKIGGYRDAIGLFNEYLRLAPQGKYAGEANEYVSKLTTEYNQKFLSTEQLDENIRTLMQQAEQSPDNLATQLALADLLWRRGEYDKSGALYKEIVTKHPDQANDLTIRARVEFQPDGQYVILTPQVVQRRQAESQPLVIINTNGFKSGEDLFTRQARYYSVTGQAVNQSQGPLNGVQVIVTIYGFGNVVYDTQTVNIGHMNPSEIRAFSVRFSNFDNIENVNRFECTGTFQK
jgi:tetratricopeptide (TPR) repeat protein